MTQPRSGAVRVAVGQLIWSSHAAPAARTPRPLAGALAAVSPTSGHAVQPPPRGRRRNGRPPGHHAAGAGRGQGPAPARQGSRRRAAQAGLPAHRQPGRPAQPARPAPGKPAQRATAPASTAPSRQTQPRRPPDPASAPSATCPGSTGFADERVACTLGCTGVRPMTGVRGYFGGAGRAGRSVRPDELAFCWRRECSAGFILVW